MAAPVLVCLDNPAPASDGTCSTTAWVEQPASLLPTLGVAEAHDIGMALLWLVAGMAALKLVGRAA